MTRALHDRNRAKFSGLQQSLQYARRLVEHRIDLASHKRQQARRTALKRNVNDRRVNRSFQHQRTKVSGGTNAAAAN